MPQRIQRKRSKGWRMPEGAVYVGRPSKWGNPFAYDDKAFATKAFRDWHRRPSDFVRVCHPPDLTDLRGKDLVCWCRLDQPCHADVLLELANTSPTEQESA